MEKNRLYYMDKVEHLDNLSYGLCRWITRVFVAQITSVICCLMLLTKKAINLDLLIMGVIIHSGGWCVVLILLAVAQIIVKKLRNKAAQKCKEI